MAGVEVGHTTLISGSGKLVAGRALLRTGVTVVHPRGRANNNPVFAASLTLNGNGEMTGTSIRFAGKRVRVGIANTHSVGVSRDAIIQWEVSRRNVLQPWWLPRCRRNLRRGVERYQWFSRKARARACHLDGALGETKARLAAAQAWCHGFKGGIGTASRKLPDAQGWLHRRHLHACSADYGARRDLRIAGVPVGEEIQDLLGCIHNNNPLPPDAARPRCGATGRHQRELTMPK